MRGSGRAMAAELAWLTHPVTLVGLALLVVNDHVLKAAYGSWWTGKLSDVAWLVLAPPLVAGLVALAGRVLARDLRLGPGVCVAVVGAVFVVTKATAVGAAAAAGVLTALAGPSVVLDDRTDLLALPALGLALLTARRSASGPATRLRSNLALLVVLPVAVLATAATSTSGPTGAAEVGVVDGVLWVGDSSGHGEGAYWYGTTDTVTWDDIGYGQPGSDQFAQAGGTAVSACAPDEKQCFRVGSSALSVERSDDGGATWATDWSVPDEDLAELAGRYEGEVRPLRTVGVAILPTADGFRVVAANGGDGLAVRDEDGTWTRTGFTYRAYDSQPAVPLPGEQVAMTYPMPLGVLLGLLAAIVVVVGSPRSTRSSTGRTTAGRWLVAGAVVVWLVALAADLQWGVVRGQPLGATITLGPVVPVLLVGVLTALATALLACGSGLARGARTTWFAVATGLAVAVVVALVPWRPALLVALAVALAGLVVSRVAPTVDEREA
ncbi:hypothetical protein [Cellulomonas sp. PhB150]|uniref:hypothetical protein n=1 Tax=Cellulomonas sp. PhB150 TaxID=2485188 RepID=UPI000FB08D59|nr:hypothetical protein [Cellulomonas sp. PhB150]ROS27871.1 hypothetical protein EDF34_1664 [Cellulomonas sp. PhB150]